MYLKSSKLRFSFLFVIVFLQFQCSSLRNNLPETTTTYVILKLDDLWNQQNEVHPGWIQVMDFLNAENVKGTIGLIGESLEGDDLNYFTWIKDRHGEGHEIWNHGFCHCRHKEGEVEIREYRGRDFEYQKESVLKTQRLAKEKLGLTLCSFGAPYNSTDEFTAAIINEIPELKIWMYKETKFPTDKFTLERTPKVNIEYPVHQPDFKQFKKGYEQFKTEPVLIIQGHPRSWTENKSRMENFKEIISFLKNEGVTFVTPYEYYLIAGNK